MTSKPSHKDPGQGHPHHSSEEDDPLNTLLEGAKPLGTFKIHCPKCGSTHLFQYVAKVICLNCGFTWLWKAHINKKKKVKTAEYL